jgi:hypothetical protein
MQNVITSSYIAIRRISLADSPSYLVTSRRLVDTPTSYTLTTLRVPFYRVAYDAEQWEFSA